MKTIDLAVIGAGPGGYVAAIEAAKAGKKVVVFEKQELGGTCLNVGCIPSKSLLESSHQVYLANDNLTWGVTKKEVKADFSAMIDRKNQVVNGLTQGIAGLFKQHGVKLVKGEATVSDDLSVTCKGENFQPKDLLLATGSQPFVPPLKGLDGVSYETTDTLFALTDVPKKLTIIGGGAVGVELSFVFAPLGTDITLIEVADDILLTEDAEARKVIKQKMKSLGIKWLTKAIIKEVKANEVILENQKVSFDRLLISAGRQANLVIPDTLGLKKSQDGKFVEVNQVYLTSKPHVYAIGDLVAGLQLAHVASAAGKQVVKHLLNKATIPFNHKLIPRCVYTTPEIASFGLSEAEAVAEGYEVLVGKAPFAYNARALTANDPVGFVKIIAEKKHHEILGAVVVGNHGTELIHILLGVAQAEGRLEELAELVFAHPTLAETIGELAADLLA